MLNFTLINSSSHRFSVEVDGWQNSARSEDKCSRNFIITNYLITESEVVTGKSQTEALPY